GDAPRRDPSVTGAGEDVLKSAVRYVDVGGRRGRGARYVQSCALQHQIVDGDVRGAAGGRDQGVRTGGSQQNGACLPLISAIGTKIDSFGNEIAPGWEL